MCLLLNRNFEKWCLPLKRNITCTGMWWNPDNYKLLPTDTNLFVAGCSTTRQLPPTTRSPSCKCWRNTCRDTFSRLPAVTATCDAWRYRRATANTSHISPKNSRRWRSSRRNMIGPCSTALTKTSAIPRPLTSDRRFTSIPARTLSRGLRKTS